MLLVVFWQCEGRRLFWVLFGVDPAAVGVVGLETLARGGRLLADLGVGGLRDLLRVGLRPRRGRRSPPAVRLSVRALDLLTLLLLLVVPLSVYLLPTVRYWKSHGPNPEVGLRIPEEAATYGLSIHHLLVPNPGHRLPTTWHLEKTPSGPPKSGEVPSANENRFNYLGAVGAAGFITMVASLFWNGHAPRSLRRLAPLGRLNVAALLLGTVGGFGLTFAVLVSPKLRAYNRISIQIAFLALAAVSVILTAVWRRNDSRSDRSVFLAALAVVLMLGLLDQTSPALVPDHRTLALTYARSATSSARSRPGCQKGR